MAVQMFLRSLHDRHDRRGGLLKRAAAAGKYGIRCALYWPLQSAWLDFVYGTPSMTAMLARDPRLLERPQHAYINRGLPQARRYAIIESHYRHLLASWPAWLVERIYTGGGASLGRLILKNGSEVELRLSVPSGRGREGELALYLLNMQGKALSSIIFTLADDGHSLLLGCLQGAAAGLGREAVREFTKQAYGLRPKNLLLSTLYALATWTGVTQMIGVSNEAHPFAGKAHKIKADYDSFWQECLGERSADGFYVLPPQEPPRDESLVESKHRSAFRRREAVRAQACDMLLAALRENSQTMSLAA